MFTIVKRSAFGGLARWPKLLKISHNVILQEVYNYNTASITQSLHLSEGYLFCI